jgi:hypothetical protein
MIFDKLFKLVFARAETKCSFLSANMFLRFQCKIMAFSEVETKCLLFGRIATQILKEGETGSIKY